MEGNEWNDDEDDLLIAQELERMEKSGGKKVRGSNTASSVQVPTMPLPTDFSPDVSDNQFSDDTDEDELLPLSSWLTNAIRQRQSKNDTQSEAFPESDDDDLDLSESLIETEEHLARLKAQEKNMPIPGSQEGSQASSVKSQGNKSKVLDKNCNSSTAQNEGEGHAGETSTAGAVKNNTNEELEKKTKSLEQVKDTFDSELQCSICNELFVQATSLNCAHAFCAFCIKQWLRASEFCPMCRTKVTSQTRSLVLDNFINRMCETLGEGMKEERQALLESREREENEYRINHPSPEPNNNHQNYVPIGMIQGVPGHYVLPTWQIAAPASPDYDNVYESSHYSDSGSSFINDDTLSGESDSLYSTNSSATDFSDHSPRSRQRRRDMRHRERRRQRQWRRNRNTDSDSSMSQGRRQEWRRQRRRLLSEDEHEYDRERDDSRERRDRSRLSRRETSSASSESSTDYTHDEESHDSDAERRHRRRWRQERQFNNADWDSSSESGGDSFSSEVSPDRGHRRGRRRGSSRRRQRIVSDEESENSSPMRRGRRPGRQRDRSRSRGRRRDRRTRMRNDLDERDSLSPPTQERHRRENANAERRRGTNRRERTDNARAERRQRRTRRDSVSPRRRHGGGGRRRETRDSASPVARRRRNNVQVISSEAESDSYVHYSDNSDHTDNTASPEPSRPSRPSRSSTRPRRNNATVTSTSGGRRNSSSRPYYGGYGNCFRCGQRGHWANGCPNR